MTPEQLYWFWFRVNYPPLRTNVRSLGGTAYAVVVARDGGSAEGQATTPRQGSSFPHRPEEKRPCTHSIVTG